MDWFGGSSRASARAVAATGIAALALAGCGTGVAGNLSSTPDPTRVSAADLVRLTRHVPCPGSGAPATRTLPAGFHAVTAVVCETDTRDYPHAGEWEVAVRRVATAGATALQDALTAPDEPRTDGACLLYLRVLPAVALVGAAGRYAVLTAPKDGCGQPQKAAARALDAAGWHEVWAHRLRRLVSPAAQAAGCQMGWKNETWLLARYGDRPSAGGPVFAPPPSTVTVCLYRAPASDLEVGTFVRGFSLGIERTRRLLAALTGPAPSTGDCAGQVEFAVISPREGQWADVELGGCWRVQRSVDNTVGTADGAAVRALIGG